MNQNLTHSTATMTKMEMKSFCSGKEESSVFYALGSLVVVCMTLGNAIRYLEYFMIFNAEWNMILNIYSVMGKD